MVLMFRSNSGAQKIMFLFDNVLRNISLAASDLICMKSYAFVLFWNTNFAHVGPTSLFVAYPLHPKGNWITKNFKNCTLIFFPCMMNMIVSRCSIIGHCLKNFEWPQSLLSPWSDEVTTWNTNHLKNLPRCCGTVFFFRCFMMKHYFDVFCSSIQLFQHERMCHSLPDTRTFLLA